MKRRNKIGWLTLALSLSFSTCAAAFLAKANDAKQVKALDPIITIGSQDMISSPSYSDGSGGTAVLDSSGDEYVLTMTNCNISLDGPFDDASSNSYVILIKDLSKNLTINLNGTNTITNTKVTAQSLSAIGFQGSGNRTFTIQTDPSAGSKATLNTYCEGTGTSYNRPIAATSLKRVVFQNVIVNSDGGPANSVSGTSNGISLFGGATVNDGAIITATGYNGAQQSYGFKVANSTFYMNGGTVNGIGGDATRYSYGVAVTTTNQSGGKLTGTAGTATNNDSVGVALYSTYTLNDGEVYSDSPASSRSYGFAPQADHGSTVQLTINSGAKRLTSSGNTKAINCGLINNCPGLGWDNALGTGDSETIETSAEARTIDYRSVDFRRMTYSAVANPAVDYDGSSHAAVSVSVTEPASGYTIGYKLSEDSEYSSSVPSFSEAGTYSIDYKISASGYADRTGTLSFTINPLDAAIATHPTLASDFTYDGTFHSLLATNGSASSGAMYYRVGSGGGWYTDIPEGKNAGNYTVYYKAGGPNYNETASYNLGTVRILNAEITNVSISQSGTLTYNGSAQTPSVSKSCTTVNSQPATYTYSDEYSAIESDYGAMPSFTSAGDHTVYYCITAPNHDSKMGSFVVTIQKVNSSVIEAPSIKTGLVYNNTSQELINAGTASGGTMVYRLGSYGWFDAAIPAVVAAGSYDIYYKVVGDANHNDSAEQLLGSAVIAPATITNISVSAPNAIYTGSAITPVVSASATTVGSLAPTFTYSTTSDGVYGDLPSFTSAGDHTVYYKVNAANHSEASGSFTFTINKADAAFVAPTAIGGLIYTSSTQTLINAGSTSDGEIQYKLSGGVYSTSLPTATNAGDYTVYYKVVGDANHNDSIESSLVVSIAAGQFTNISVTAANASYTGSAITPVVSASATAIGSTTPEFTYSATSDGVYGALPSFTTAGVHTIYYKINASNHAEASGSFEFNIAKTDSTFEAPTAISGLVVTGSDLTLINAGTSSTGTLVYRLGETGEFSTTLPAVTEAGTYTIYYMVLGDENHNDSEIQSIVVTVAPAPSGDTPSDPPAPEPGTSEPGTSVPGTSEPGTPTNSEPKSFPVWAAVVIPVGGTLLVFGLLLLLFFFALNKWVIHNGKPVRVYKIGKKDDKVKLLTLGFKVILKDESEIFDSKADALKLLK